MRPFEHVIVAPRTAHDVVDLLEGPDSPGGTALPCAQTTRATAVAV